MENNEPVVTVNSSGDEFEHKDRSVTNMIFGIVSAVLAWFPVLSIAAIIFGAIAVKRSKENKQFALSLCIQESGMNTAGYATGLVGVIAGSILTFLYLLAITFILIVTTGIVTGGLSHAFSAVY